MRLKPIDLAAQWYVKHVPDGNFADAVAENFRRDNGHVYACADLFAMGQDVGRGAEADRGRRAKRLVCRAGRQHRRTAPSARLYGHRAIPAPVVPLAAAQ